MTQLPRPHTLLAALTLLATALTAPAVCAQALRGAPTLRPGDHIAVVVNQELVTAYEVNQRMTALRRIGVPYSSEEIAKAAEQTAGKTELDALVAYLQVLGTAVK